MPTESLERLNALPESSAESALMHCCGSRTWTGRMLAMRPFATGDALFAAADRAWEGLARDDRLEAFRAHPRIGERASGSDRHAQWSAQEQSGAANAAERVRAELAAANAEYERRFGHIFIVCASGKSAEEMLALLRARMGNDPESELAIAAEEQRKIMRLRLEKLLRG